LVGVCDLFVCARGGEKMPQDRKVDH